MKIGGQGIMMLKPFQTSNDHASDWCTFSECIFPEGIEDQVFHDVDGNIILGTPAGPSYPIIPEL